MQAVIDRLLVSHEPSIRFAVRVGVLGEDPASLALRALRGKIQSSPRVRARGLYRRARDGEVMQAEFTRLHYPCYWRFDQTARPAGSWYDLVSWGGVSRRRLNEWVTADALVVLHRAGRLGTTAEPHPVAVGRATSERGGRDERPAR